MDGTYPFMSMFPKIYPECRHVRLDREPDLIGITIKSLLFLRKEEMFLCNGLVVQTTDPSEVYRTVHIKVTGLAPVVGYDLDLGFDQPDVYENWDDVRSVWSARFAGEPVNVTVFHDDIKRTVNAMVFPLKSIFLAQRFIQSVGGSLTFGDFCPDRGYYLTRDGNTPAVCANLMFGRTYFVSRHRLNEALKLREFIYDHEKSEMEVKRFDSVHLPYFYRSACIDIETVFDRTFQDRNLKRDTFKHKFPYCTEGLLADMASRRDALIRTLNDNKKHVPTQCKQVRIPPLGVDMPGEQHEITCVSLVILNTHITKLSPEHHRKQLLVLYNKLKSTNDPYPAKDVKLAHDVGIEDVTRIQFFPCSGELALLEKTVAQLRKHQIDLLYVYNAEFDLRVLEQRVYFYAESEYSRGQDLNTQRRCTMLLCAWNNLFVRGGTSSKDSVHRFQFETVRYLEMYRQMLESLRLLIDKASTESGWLAISASIEMFNKNKAKLGHFKMDSCGLNVIDLYRVAETRDVKFACTSMKLNDVAPFIVAKARQLRGKPAKDVRKLCKVADVSYSRMDEMIRAGGKSLFAVLVYNLVDSQLCARLAKALNPVSALFHRCRATLNIDVVVHGRGDMFGGFVQSIHSVQIPQLKCKLDTLRAQTGPVGKELGARRRWEARAESKADEMWKGGSVCDPLTGLHYAGPRMGLELSFDFASMYPSIMCALNISPETTVPWPPSRFSHDLSGWVCYNWEAEGFEYATLILKYDPQSKCLVRAPAVLASSVEHYLNKRTEFKRKLTEPDLSDVELAYYKVQEGECKVLANSFYGTAPYPCGPMISGHGRRQISLVNSCVSSFYEHRCPVVYGDTDSVMVSVGCGPDEASEREVNESQMYASAPPDVEREREQLLEFTRQAQIAVRDKFLKAKADVPNFLHRIHVELVKDALERMYVIQPGNRHKKILLDPEGRLTEKGYPIYLAEVPGSKEPCSVTESFVSGRRVKLEYENSSSVYCHVAKKTYVSLVHTFDHDKMDISSISVKARGLVAFKSVRSPCDSALTETFIACVMRGDCIKMENDRVPCFTTCPWHQLTEGDTVLYVDRDLRMDNFGLWLDMDEAGELLRAFKVERVMRVELDLRTLAVSVMLRPSTDTVSDEAGAVTVVRTLHKDGKYCVNHIFSRTQAIVRDLLACKASELICSQIGAGFFPWSRLIKSSKNKHFSKQTLDRLRVNSSSVKTSYMEIVKTWLHEITGLSTKPVQCCEYYKCKPCEAAFHKYPLNLQAERGCITAMFGGSLICERDTEPADPKHSLLQTLDNSESPAPQEELVSHSHMLLDNCYGDSRVSVAHLADKTLMNTSGKLVAHCIVDYCLPGRMFSDALRSRCLEDCKTHLIRYVASVRARLKRAGAAFTALMNNCPEHMIPALDAAELEYLRAKRENVTRLSGDKLEACRKVVQEDMFLSPARMYESLCALLKEKLERATSEGTISMVNEEHSASRGTKAYLRLSIPRIIEQNIGLQPTCDGTLYVTESELRERDLVDLAGVLYQIVVMLQVHNPDAFSSNLFRYPDTVLYIMPYSCADIALVQNWIVAFKSKKWLKPRSAQLGKRKLSCGNPVDVSYHCVGCKNFYMDLFANKVSGQMVMQRVYDDKKIRRIGRCVSEKRWLL